VAVAGTKRALLYARDHPVRAGLDQVATWNMAMLQTGDVMEAATAAMQKRPAVFPKL
jgi:enoyl-CoA hydratase